MGFPTRYRVLLAAFLLLGASSPAQAQSDGSRSIRVIEVRRVGVFDSAESANSGLFRFVNRMHFQTRESVIRSELLFRPGDPFDSGLVAETARNLRNLALFRSVMIDSVRSDSGLVARVWTSDAWTTSLGVDFQTSGGQGYFNTSYIDSNFLGLGSEVLLRYGQYSDYNATELEYTHPRLIARRVDVDVYHESQSTGNVSFVVLDYPFRTLASPFGISLTAREADGRVLRFLAGRAAAVDTLQNRTMKFLLRAGKAVHADARDYVRIGLMAQLLRNDYLDESSRDSFPRNLTLAIGPTLDISHAHFLTTDDYHHLHQVEDVDLSASLSLGALMVTRPGVHAVAPFGRLRLGEAIPGGFGILEGMASGQFSSTGLDSGSAVIGATITFRAGGTRQRLFLHAEAGTSFNTAPLDQYDLGLGFGPRAFGSHAFTGDRYHNLTAEYRYTISPELGHVAAVGVALFADRGGAWYEGSASRVGTDVGIGLRIGPTREAGLRTLGIDLVRRFANDVKGAGWVLVVGKGFTFNIAQ
jgi:hypothetical protein